MSVKNSRTSTFVVLAAAVLGSVAIAPAGAIGNWPTGTLDELKLENYIARDLSRDLTEVQIEVTCPDDVLIEKGRKSTCTATVDGQKLLYQITQISGRGDVRYKRAKAVIDLNRVQSLVAREVAQQMGGKWRIKCSVPGGSRFFVVAVGKSFSCPISGKDGEGVSRIGSIVYHVQSLRGDIDWEAR